MINALVASQLYHMEKTLAVEMFGETHIENLAEKTLANGDSLYLININMLCIYKHTTCKCHLMVINVECNV